ncbi:LytR C-terminal domain-containing protein [Kineococcus gynurae]|uniref:LytR C-terminal domain-containing protein n=1 Tax=Kineococcus gynurae TaxID=452979 RepID=A0ABV5LTY9_9ACTN
MQEPGRGERGVAGEDPPEGSDDATGTDARAGAGDGPGLAEDFDEVDSADRLARRRRRRLLRQRIVFAVLVLAVVVAGGIAALVATDRWPNSPEPSAGPSAPPASCAPVRLPAPAEVSLTVLNGTDRRGLAAAVAGEFGQRGFTVTRVGNAAVAPGPVPAVVQYGPGEIAAAQAVAARIEGAQLAERPEAGVVLELGDGYAQLRAEDALAVPATNC